MELWALDAPLLLERMSLPMTTDDGDQRILFAFSFMLSKYDEHFVDDVDANKYLAESLLRFQKTSPSMMRQLSGLEWSIEMQAACVRILTVTVLSYTQYDYEVVVLLGPILRFSLALPFSSFDARRERNLLLYILAEGLRDYLSESYHATAAVRYATEEAILKTLSSHRTEAGISLRQAVTDWQYWENREGPNDARIVLRRFASIVHCLESRRSLEASADWQVLLKEVEDLEATHNLHSEPTSEENDQGLGIYAWMGRRPGSYVKGRPLYK